MLKPLFHLFGAIYFAYGCYYDYVYVNIPSTATSTVTPHGGKFRYLTYLNAMIQTLYFTLALLNDSFGNEESSFSIPERPSQNPLIRKVKDTVFGALAFPLAIFVGVSFWGIYYAVDRELILPRAMDEYFPTYHVMHSNIAVVFILIELWTSFMWYPKTKLSLSILSCFMICYLVWIHVIYYNTGIWVYPILSVLNWPVRVGFYIFCLALLCGAYCLGRISSEFIQVFKFLLPGVIFEFSQRKRPKKKVA